MNKPTQTENKKNRHTLRNAIIAILASALLLIVLLLAAVFSLKPIPAVNPIPDPQEQIALAKFSGKVFKTVSQAGQQRQADCVFRFTSEEINAVMNNLLRIWHNSKDETDPDIYIRWQNGLAQIAASYEWCGLYLNIYMTAAISIHSGKLSIKIESCRLGSLPLPPGKVEEAVAGRIAELTASEHCARILSMVERMQAQDNDVLEVVVNTRYAPGLMMSFF